MLPSGEAIIGDGSVQIGAVQGTQQSVVYRLNMFRTRGLREGCNLSLSGQAPLPTRTIKHQGVGIPYPMSVRLPMAGLATVYHVCVRTVLFVMPANTQPEWIQGVTDTNHCTRGQTGHPRIPPNGPVHG